MKLLRCVLLMPSVLALTAASAMAQSYYEQGSGANGLVSLEGERFHSKVDQGGHAWTPQSIVDASGGQAVQATPNNGTTFNSGYAVASPRLDFRVYFNRTGQHYIWIRGRGATGADDSLHVGLNGLEISSCDRISGFGTGFTWSKNTMDAEAAWFYVPTVGVHTVNVWMREDGFVLDKVVVTSSTTYIPAGTGPAASVRVDPPYQVWIRQVAAGTEPSVRDAIIARQGEPDPASWTLVGTGTATKDFNPAAAAGTFNAVLIKANASQNYSVDGIEIVTAAGVIVENAAQTIYYNLVSDPAEVLGSPNGVPAMTLAVPGGPKAFLFTTFSQPIDRFRISLWGQARGPGDLEWVRTLSRPGASDRAGGADVSANGTVYASFHDDLTQDVWLVRYDSAGNMVPNNLWVNIEAQFGTLVPTSHAVAIDNVNGYVYVGSTVKAGDVRVRQYFMDMVERRPDPNNPDMHFYELATANEERIGTNGLAIDPQGNVLIAGGAKFPPFTNGLDHWMNKIGKNRENMWSGPPVPPNFAQERWWHAVAVDALGNPYGAGDLAEPSGSTGDVFLAKVEPDWHYPLWTATPSSPGTADRGNSIGVDAAGNVWVGGHLGSATQGLNASLHKLTPGGVPVGGVFPLIHSGSGGGDDEILDIAVQPDGTVYATGYETVAGQGQNFWVRKFSPAGAVLWTRTYDHGFGNDRGVSISINGSSVYVVGEVTLPNGQMDIHVRKYAK